jgi:GNAT superfamily N-acetyltransferase
MVFAIRWYLFFALATALQASDHKPSIAIIHEQPMLPSNNDASVVIKEKFTLLVDGKRRGFINWNGYVSDSVTAGLYSFYIEKEYRDKGYGSLLLQNILNHLAELNYRQVLLIPGPQEMVNGELKELEGTERDAAMVRLVKFYRKNGFVTDPYNEKQMVHYLQKKKPVTSYKPYVVLGCTGACAVILYILLRKIFARWKKSRE